ncbi:hypothetical protein EVAR_79186_1 [Eumeta japonica]|uniref:Uncharacterized protein n=1 Tax=Eumeta variegata TaxID=151549 RepID=A0A4C1UUD7_EUMVA|nr:hypothetical protein EVAR_79186_1 [Eumeta japonica]
MSGEGLAQQGEFEVFKKRRRHAFNVEKACHGRSRNIMRQGHAEAKSTVARKWLSSTTEIAHSPGYSGEVAASAVAFRPEHEGSGSPPPPIKYPIPS